MSTFVIIVASSYLLGSIPFGYLLVRIFHGEDVRRSGSGNIGATNVSRKSPALGAVTLLLDALKGSAAVAIAFRLSNAAEGKPIQAMALAALLAVLGHMHPIWLKFRGGKGVATGLGSFVVIAPKAVLLAVGIFALIVAIFRYVSLGSILAAASFPFLLLYKPPAEGNSSIAMVLMIVTSLLIIGEHHENIRRLLSGSESRVGSKHT
ncbi:MAG: glycerol-3-phosphate 1-O-acyltransferase PlsY [Candidatus Sulfotelmatobacter sp.]